MTRILLIRHGQASFGTDDYDRLSTLGEEQSERVGEHLAALPHSAAAAYSGKLRRQRQTLDLAIGRYGADALPQRASEAFNEYQAGPLFDAYLDQVVSESPALAAARDAVHTDRRLFQQAFEGVMNCWLEGRQTATAIPETWEQFQGRIVQGLEAMVCEHDKNDTIHLYTSGGVIAVGVGLALELSPLQTVMLNWRVYNASITELSYGRRGWSLMGFNAVDHFALTEPDRLLTFR
ncbi:MAG: histidine phosphatase family protein [Ectothiorhodospiraceae bacterium]|nr:histidine phosphatase family protein [Ectothiorhodospiraceae bacterium]MCH8504681.1 histidine phosphatase family protein [Ectothiorhodospiraceae bacterium]